MTDDSTKSIDGYPSHESIPKSSQRSDFSTPDLTDMVREGDIWIDQSEVLAADAPAPLFKPAAEQPAPDSWARLKFDEALRSLERQGKRLPWLSELREALINQTVLDSDPEPEWVMDVQRVRFIERAELQGRSVAIVTHRYFSIEGPVDGINVISRLGFRGVRSDTPIVSPLKDNPRGDRSTAQR